MDNKAREYIKPQLGGSNSSRWQLFGYIFYYYFFSGLFPQWPWNSCWSDGSLALFLFGLQAVLGRLVSIHHFPFFSFSLWVSPLVTCIWKRAWSRAQRPQGLQHKRGWALISLASYQLESAAGQPRPGPGPVPAQLSPWDCGRAPRQRPATYSLPHRAHWLIWGGQRWENKS